MFGKIATFTRVSVKEMASDNLKRSLVIIIGLVFLVCCISYYSDTNWFSSTSTLTKESKSDKGLLSINGKKLLDLFKKKMKQMDIDKNYEEWLEERKQINQKRLQNMRKVCQKYPLEIKYEELATFSFIFNQKLKMMGCSINKVGSTSLGKTFKALRRSLDYPDENPNKVRIKVNEKQLYKQRSLYKKFVFVRDPMERLASAYNDKMIVNDHPWFVKVRKNVKEMAVKIKGARNSPGNQVSFDDFLNAVVIPGKDSPSEWGRHWAPYYKICAPCTMQFDYIGRLDLTGEESQVVLMLD